MHFINGIKRGYHDLPQILPWQKYTYYTAAKHQLSPAEIIYHDHCYCLPHYWSVSVVSTGSSYLTPITARDILHLSLPTIDTSTNTYPLIQSQTPFSIELFINNDDAIHFCTGFESYDLLMICFRFLGDAVRHLQYSRTSTEKSAECLATETRGAPRALTPLNEFFQLSCADWDAPCMMGFGIS